ncbi:BZ3500_MvSof-1268-A1-R1_Chr1-3g01772 [Microbotryum saponariae]|uniref:BZ3500_MvSof-1268-A1-R1_Chr1-3g01772 protein n=1 Tax=Microbotryum saponariae TaxID=289078 RepID=A0A2X0ME08_9BASI|nr:BZ3500_MvSof-1268-A1-R1_Chr1-3g01772 [Microbotryum saponariae]SCZ94554.1 BZ3501_MvSof-1269-A2-R1_Chr1-3g01374 [Microbotryum saponariae]
MAHAFQALNCAFSKKHRGIGRVVGAHMIGITLLVVSEVWGLHGSSGYDFT